MRRRGGVGWPLNRFGCALRRRTPRGRCSLLLRRSGGNGRTRGSFGRVLRRLTAWGRCGARLVGRRGRGGPLNFSTGLLRWFTGRSRRSALRRRRGLHRRRALCLLRLIMLLDYGLVRLVAVVLALQRLLLLHLRIAVT